jgi:hypothetical protein
MQGGISESAVGSKKEALSKGRSPRGWEGHVRRSGRSRFVSALAALVISPSMPFLAEFNLACSFIFYPPKNPRNAIVKTESILAGSGN